MNNLFSIKYVDLPVEIGGSIGGSLRCALKDVYNKMGFVKGSSYYFNVIYLNKPITRLGVPYKPVKLKIMDIKNVKDILRSVYEDKQTHDHYHKEFLIYDYQKGLINDFKGYEYVKDINSEFLFQCAIEDMVLMSDLITDIWENEYNHVWGLIKFPTVDDGPLVYLSEEEAERETIVTRNYVLNLTVAVYQATN